MGVSLAWIILDLFFIMKQVVPDADLERKVDDGAAKNDSLPSSLIPDQPDASALAPGSDPEMSALAPGLAGEEGQKPAEPSGPMHDDVKPVEGQENENLPPREPEAFSEDDGGGGGNGRDKVDAAILPPQVPSLPWRDVPRAPLGSKSGWTTMPWVGGSRRSRSGGRCMSPTELAQRRGMAAVDALRHRFPIGRSLPAHWGLLSLVEVGEAWLPVMLAWDADHRPNDPRHRPDPSAAAGSSAMGGGANARATALEDGRDEHISKLFEFLVASVCLYMTEERLEAERRGLDLFVLSAPVVTPVAAMAEVARGGRKGCRSAIAGRGGAVAPQSWWTVEARAPEPEATSEAGSIRTVSLLLGLLGMHLDTTWKVVQL